MTFPRQQDSCYDGNRSNHNHQDRQSYSYMEMVKSKYRKRCNCQARNNGRDNINFIWQNAGSQPQ